MRDSTCRWLIVENAKIGIIKFLEFSHVKETEEYANKF